MQTFWHLGLVCAFVTAAPLSGQDEGQVSHHEFETSDGVRLHYLEAGSGDVMIFVPGWRMPASIWERQVDFFKDRYRVIALDPRGHGESDPATTGLFRSRRAQDVQELLEAASVERAILVGWSMAVGELLTYVDEFGTSRLSGLVLVDWPFRFSQPFREGVTAFALRYLKEPETVAYELLPTFFSSPQDEEWLEDMTQASLSMPIASAVAILLEVTEEADWSSTLQALDRPILYTVSPTYAAYAEELRSLTPEANIQVVEGAAHGFFWDLHAEFNRALLDFAQSLTP